MATFKEGDWVQITPSPDTRWEYWGSEHSSMTGKFGKIEEIEVAPNDPTLIYLRIGVYDEKDVALGEEWFLPKHVILSTRYNKVLSDGFKKACDDLQIWEKKKRQMLNESLEKAFGLRPMKPEKETKTKKKKKKKSDSARILTDDGNDDDWEEDTQEFELDDCALSAFEDLYYDSTWDPPDGTD